MANVAPKKDADAVRRLVADIYDKNLTVGHEAICSLAKEYQKKYAEWFSACHLYHVMIGSTPFEIADHADFPGADSVIIQLRDILDSI